MKRIVILCLIGAVTGCQNPMTKRFYTGETRPAEAVARVHDSPRVGTTAVDGQQFAWWGNHIVEILPGERELSVSFASGVNSRNAYILKYSKTDYLLRFNATAGTDYQLDIEENENRATWRPLLIDMKTGRQVPYQPVDNAAIGRSGSR